MNVTYLAHDPRHMARVRRDLEAQLARETALTSLIESQKRTDALLAEDRAEMSRRRAQARQKASELYWTGRYDAGDRSDLAVKAARARFESKNSSH